jgi:cytosine/adenosine deaminase-related metal-dependent hydrolase
VLLAGARVVAETGEAANTLRLAAGRVRALGAAAQWGDEAVDLRGAFVYPGMVNAHDHLELNNFPALKWRLYYPNAREWIADFQPRFVTDPALAGPLGVPLDDRLFVGGLKNLLSGATTVCHHNPLRAALRRREFPVRVVTRMRYSHSLLIDGETVAAAYRRTPRHWPWIIHAAEGTDAEAAAELDRLEALGCLGPNTVLVHGVGLDARARARLVAQGGGLIWCPTSNVFLLGATAQVADLAQAGRVALGSDSRLSGARDLLDELRHAAATGQVTPRELFRMVTTSAAAVLRLPAAGRLGPGLPADLFVLPELDPDPFQNLVAASRADVRLVMLGGRPRLADEDLAPLFDWAGVPALPVTVDGRAKLMERALAERLRASRAKEPGLALANGQHA